LTSSRFISFIERSTSDNVFVPGRELGIAAYRVSADQNWTLGYGGFFHDVSEVTKEINDSNMGFLAAGRVTWTPYYDEPSNGRYYLHLGTGATYTDFPGNTKTYSSRPGTHLGDTFINTGALPISEQAVVNGELLWVNGRFSVQGELFLANADRADVVGTHDYYGAYLFASYFLTGEHRPYRRANGIVDRVVPYSNFWMVPGCAGPGAWEALIRWSAIDFSDNPGAAATSFTSQMNDITLGLNWYWNPNMKMMFNYAKVYTDGGVFDGLEGDWFGVSTRFDF
jgi:phosphate-selective porin OprO/OprP